MVKRLELPTLAPRALARREQVELLRALARREQVELLRAVERRGSARDAAIAAVLSYRRFGSASVRRSTSRMCR